MNDAGLFTYGVTAVTAESYGCVWHLQQRYAGHDVLEVSLEWTYGAITFLNGRYSKIGARCPMRNEHGYNSSLGPTRVGAIQTPVRGGPK